MDRQRPNAAATLAAVLREALARLVRADTIRELDVRTEVVGDQPRAEVSFVDPAIPARVAVRSLSFCDRGPRRWHGPRVRSRRSGLHPDGVGVAIPRPRPSTPDRRGVGCLDGAGAFALALLGTEYLAKIATEQVLPDRAIREYLDRHGRRRASPWAATAASLLVALTGAPSTTADATTAAMVSAAGVRFTFPGSTLELDGAGEGSATIECSETGTDNPLPGAVVTFVTAPAGFDVTGTVAGTVALGRRRRRTPRTPLGSSRTASAARVRPRARIGGRGRRRSPAWTPPTSTRRSTTPSRRRCFGGRDGGRARPGPGDAVDRTRIVNASLTTRVAGYIEGTVDADGDAVATAEQVQKRPVTLGSYTILAATPQGTDVTIEVDPDAGYPFCYGRGRRATRSPRPRPGAPSS